MLHIIFSIYTQYINISRPRKITDMIFAQLYFCGAGTILIPR